MPAMDDMTEWLEADGMGGFASGTVVGCRTRRYHALLLVAKNPPAERMVLVNGFDARVTTPAGAFWISSQLYDPDVIAPDGANRIADFTTEPWPSWRFRLEDGARIQQEIFVPRGAAAVVLWWRLLEPRDGVAIHVWPFFSGRDFHALHHENRAFRFDPEQEQGRQIWRPYEGIPRVIVWANGAYEHRPVWYRNFAYRAERDRGLDFIEDLAAPGEWSFDLSRGEAVCILAAEGHEGDALSAGATPEACAAALHDREKRRRNQADRLERAVDSYIVQRGAGKTIVAGYPWFGDWGRDTFISLRGLCLATGRFDTAREILVQWAGAVSQGMLPNRFPDRGETPEFNSVDASLWYVIAVDEFLRAAEAGRTGLAADERQRLLTAIDAILSGYVKGTRYRIHLDDDGLLAAGEPGVQLTWMDAKVGDWVVTPRIGKPVEVQALWLNALNAASRFKRLWAGLYEKGLRTFGARFWNSARGCLYDLVDCDHQAGAVDGAVRPNQIFAVGGLPLCLLEAERARKVVAVVEERLLTPIGLRSLAPGEAGYCGHYEGGVRERDGAYHQGTAWPWLMGPFAQAWVRVRGGGAEAQREARRRFLVPLLEHLDVAGIGHIAEIGDGDPPFTPRGCPFQAWSLGEALRLSKVVLGDGARGKRRRNQSDGVAKGSGRG